MKKKIIRRIATLVAAAAIGVGSMCMFAGCTSDHPEVTITYSFNGNEYAVTYTLSRKYMPETVQHFIEVADSGFYDGTIIHNYNSSFLYGGAYYVNEENEIEAKDYFSYVKEYEKDHDAFTQTVFKVDENNQKGDPLYSVVGEFDKAGRIVSSGAEYVNTKGALAMYYPDVGEFSYNVFVERADGGKNNNGDPYDIKEFKYNCATSQFYTFCGEYRSDLDGSYAVFGMAKDFDGEMQPLLDAIEAYKATLDESESFTTKEGDDGFPHLFPFGNAYGTDPDFDDLRRSGIYANDYEIPIKKKIVVTSVKVDKY